MNWVERLHGRSASVWLLAMLAGGPGCHRPPPSLDAAPSASAPHDRLAPGELVEGSLHAFELGLPVGMQIREAFSSVVYVAGPVDPMKLANYLRARVTGGSISVGAAATVFDQVTTSANKKRILRLRVESLAAGRAAQLEVRDVTPPPVPPAADDAERWRRAGMTPDGKLIDPSHLR